MPSLTSSKIRDAGFVKDISSEDDEFVRFVGDGNLYTLREVMDNDFAAWLERNGKKSELILRRVSPAIGALYRAGVENVETIPLHVLNAARSVFNRRMESSDPLLVAAVMKKDPHFVYTLAGEVDDPFFRWLMAHGQGCALNTYRVDPNLFKELLKTQTGRGKGERTVAAGRSLFDGMATR